MYNSNEELYKSIDNDSHSYLTANNIKDYVFSNLNKVTHVNGLEVINVSKIDSSTIEYQFKGYKMTQTASIIMNNIKISN